MGSVPTKLAKFRGKKQFSYQYFNINNKTKALNFFQSNKVYICTCVVVFNRVHLSFFFYKKYTVSGKRFARGKVLLAAISEQIGSTSRWAKELIFKKWKSSEFWFRICNKNWLFHFEYIFFFFKKLTYFGSFFTCQLRWYQQIWVFQITISWRAH